VGIAAALPIWYLWGMQNFRKLRAWQQAMDTAVQCYALSDLMPGSERYGLRTQIQRAGVSIPANIAEGSGRRTDREYVRFLRIAYGSACEAETHALLAKRLGLAAPDAADELIRSIIDSRRMLSGLIGKIQNDAAPGARR